MSLIKEMKRRGIRDPFDLTETDQWVNDATRVDIKAVYEKESGHVFGFDLWTGVKIRGDELLNCPNFGCAVIVREENEAKVDESYAAYKKGELTADKYIDTVFDLAAMSATWV